MTADTPVTRYILTPEGERAASRLLPKSIKHGTHYAYVQGCRCDDCRAARRAYQKAWHERQREARSVPTLPKQQAALSLRTLDSAVAKVGQDFPSIGALLRAGWTGAA